MGIWPILRKIILDKGQKGEYLSCLSLMLGKTSLLAIRTLLCMVQGGPGAFLSLKNIADALGESPSYLAKVTRLLSKSGILRATKGMRGGVRLNRAPAEISLLSIVEACQGVILGDYCHSDCDPALTCAYHQAAVELQRATKEVLGRWTLADLAQRPRPTGELPEGMGCVLVKSGGGETPSDQQRPVQISPTQT